jgi:hypothetical protein
LLKFLSIPITFTTRYTAYGVGIAGAAAISAVLAVSFGIYYARAINFPLNDTLVMIIYVGSVVAAVGHSVQFGALYRMGFPGFTRPVRAINRFIVAAPNLQIRAEAKDEDLAELLRALGLIPIINALTPVIAVQVVFTAVVIAAQFTGSLTFNNYISLGIMNLMISFVHGGY